MNETKSPRYLVENTMISGKEVPVPYLDFGTKPAWVNFLTRDEPDVERAKALILNEIQRVIQEEVFAFRGRVYEAPLAVSATVQPGHFVIDSEGNICVNEKEAEHYGNDSDGDRATLYLCDRTDRGALIKFPLTRKVPILKRQQWVNPKLDYSDIDISALADEPVKMTRARFEELWDKTHSDANVGINTIAADGIEISRINNQGIVGAQAREYLGSTDTRHYLIENGMKAARGHELNLKIGRIENIMIESADRQFLHQRAPALEGLSFMGPKELKSAQFRFFNLMGFRTTKVRDPFSPLPVPVKKKIPYNKFLFNKLVKLGMLRVQPLDHKDPFLGGCMYCTVHDQYGNPVGLKSTKRGQTEVNYGFVVIPQVEIDIFFEDTDKNEFEIGEVYWDGTTYRSLYDGTQVFRQESVVTVKSAEEVLVEALATVYLEDRSYGNSWSDITTHARTTSKIQRELEQTAGRCGFFVFEFDGKLNAQTVEMAKRCFQINYGTLDKNLMRLGRDLVLAKFLANSEYVPNLLGGDKGKWRSYGTYTLGVGKDMRPTWAPHNCSPYRPAHAKKQLANSYPLPEQALVVIPGGGTETQMYATPEGLELQKLPNGVFMPQIVSPEVEEAREHVHVNIMGEKIHVHLVDPKFTADTGKLVSKFGTKNQLAPCDPVWVLDEEGKEVPAHYIMSQVEFQNKDCFNAVIDKCLVSFQDVEIEGKSVQCAVVRMQFYRTLSQSENMAPGYRTQKFCRLSGLMVASAIERLGNYEHTDLDPDLGLPEYKSDGYLESLQRAFRELKIITTQESYETLT